jgi:phosphoribosylglycinamide formyltransferase-1
MLAYISFYRKNRVPLACYGSCIMRPRIIVFASGTKDGGGSGFENLVKSPDLDADIVAVVSNHERGGVHARAEKLGVPFIFFPGPFDAEHYSGVLQRTGIDAKDVWLALSGWLKKVEGLNPAKTFNIHPALLSAQNRRFGGTGLYGHHVHEAVKHALDEAEITESGVTMHFVTPIYDEGPIFFEYRIPLRKDMSADDIALLVNAAEHQWQPKMTNLVVHGEISWNGRDASSLIVPKGYIYLPK